MISRRGGNASSVSLFLNEKTILTSLTFTHFLGFLKIRLVSQFHSFGLSSGTLTLPSRLRTVLQDYPPISPQIPITSPTFKSIREFKYIINLKETSINLLSQIRSRIVLHLFCIKYFSFFIVCYLTFSLVTIKMNLRLLIPIWMKRNPFSFL